MSGVSSFLFFFGHGLEYIMGVVVQYITPCGVQKGGGDDGGRHGDGDGLQL